ncbi:MAG: hypothetical protein SFU98_07715 [Leptospiraceae bacterium]|nr:hypothetical protein [Leptospiraceae bacterium]
MNNGLNLDDFDLDIDPISNSNKKDSSKFVYPKFRNEEKFFILELIKTLENNIHRGKSIITNLKNSRVFDLTGDPSENKNIVGNIDRDFEVEILTRMEVANSKYKEITEFPKPISHYLNNYSRIQKDRLNHLSNERARFDQILAWEMFDQIQETVNTFGKILSEILTLISQKSSVNSIRVLNVNQQKMFEDAKATTIFCMKEIDQFRKQLEIWQNLKLE